MIKVWVYYKIYLVMILNLFFFCRSGFVYCYIKNLIMLIIFSNYFLYVLYKKRYKIDICESINISFLKV